MEIRLLRYFLAAAAEENITRAAESLHIAQPSLSKQIMELENELGKQLFVRGKRKLTLTEEGVLLRKRAEEILALVERTEQEISLSDEEISGEVAIGGMPTAAVLAAAARTREKYPNVRFNFYSGDAVDVAERMESGSLDFAVMLRPVDMMKYESLPLPDSSRWGLALPKENALCKKGCAAPEDLRGLPLILHRRAGLQREIALWAGTEPELLNVAATYNVINGSVITVARSGLGCLLTAEDKACLLPEEDVCFCPLEPPLTLNYAIVRKRRAAITRAAQAFLSELKVLCAKEQQKNR